MVKAVLVFLFFVAVGSFAQTQICESDFCEHGTCVPGISPTVCKCEYGWSGDKCNVEKPRFPDHVTRAMSDIHIGSQRSDDPAKQVKLCEFLEKMTDPKYQFNESVTSLMFAGDTFELWAYDFKTQPPTINELMTDESHPRLRGFPITRFVNAVRKLSDQLKNVYFLAGNHDIQGKAEDVTKVFGPNVHWSDTPVELDQEYVSYEHGNRYALWTAPEPTLSHPWAYYLTRSHTQRLAANGGQENEEDPTLDLIMGWMQGSNPMAAFGGWLLQSKFFLNFLHKKMLDSSSVWNKTVEQHLDDMIKAADPAVVPTATTVGGDFTLRQALAKYEAFPKRLGKARGYSYEQIGKMAVGEYKKDYSYFIARMPRVDVTVFGHTHHVAVQKYKRVGKRTPDEMEEIIYANTGTWSEDFDPTYIDVIYDYPCPRPTRVVAINVTSERPAFPPTCIFCPAPAPTLAQLRVWTNKRQFSFAGAKTMTWPATATLKVSDDADRDNLVTLAILKRAGVLNLNESTAMLPNITWAKWPGAFFSVSQGSLSIDATGHITYALPTSCKDRLLFLANWWSRWGYQAAETDTEVQKLKAPALAASAPAFSVSALSSSRSQVHLNAAARTDPNVMQYGFHAFAPTAPKPGLVNSILGTRPRARAATKGANTQAVRVQAYRPTDPTDIHRNAGSVSLSGSFDITSILDMFKGLGGGSSGGSDTDTSTSTGSDTTSDSTSSGGFGGLTDLIGLVTGDKGTSGSGSGSSGGGFTDLIGGLFKGNTGSSSGTTSGSTSGSTSSGLDFSKILDLISGKSSDTDSDSSTDDTSSGSTSSSTSGGLSSILNILKGLITSKDTSSTSGSTTGSTGSTSGLDFSKILDMITGKSGSGTTSSGSTSGTSGFDFKKILAIIPSFKNGTSGLGLPGGLGDIFALLTGGKSGSTSGTSGSSSGSKLDIGNILTKALLSSSGGSSLGLPDSITKLLGGGGGGGLSDLGGLDGILKLFNTSSTGSGGLTSYLSKFTSSFGLLTNLTDRLTAVGDDKPWNCNILSFNASDGVCNCNCGSWDPDCDVSKLLPGQTLRVAGCDLKTGALPTCIKGTSDNVDAKCDYLAIVPDVWTCDKAKYGGGDGCDCNCGAWDPDCAISQTPLRGCAAGQQCKLTDNLLSVLTKLGLKDDLVAKGECVKAESVTVPSTFHCSKDYFDKNDGCDCGCGSVDPDCAKPGQSVTGCSCSADEVPMCSTQGTCMCQAKDSSLFANMAAGQVGTREMVFIGVGGGALLGLVGLGYCFYSRQKTNSGKEQPRKASVESTGSEPAPQANVENEDTYAYGGDPVSSPPATRSVGHSIAGRRQDSGVGTSRMELGTSASYYDHNNMAPAASAPSTHSVRPHDQRPLPRVPQASNASISRRSSKQVTQQ